jgi:hypothetical protein
MWIQTTQMLGKENGDGRTLRALFCHIPDATHEQAQVNRARAVTDGTQSQLPVVAYAGRCHDRKQLFVCQHALAREIFCQPPLEPDVEFFEGIFPL